MSDANEPSEVSHDALNIRAIDACCADIDALLAKPAGTLMEQYAVQCDLVRVHPKFLEMEREMKVHLSSTQALLLATIIQELLVGDTVPAAMQRMRETLPVMHAMLTQCKDKTVGEIENARERRDFWTRRYAELKATASMQSPAEPEKPRNGKRAAPVDLERPPRSKGRTAYTIYNAEPDVTRVWKTLTEAEQQPFIVAAEAEDKEAKKFHAKWCDDHPEAWTAFQREQHKLAKAKGKDKLHKSKKIKTKKAHESEDE